MKNRAANGNAMVVALVSGWALIAIADVLAAEKFTRLSGSQIRARFSGMEMTDEIHWRESYKRDGSFNSRSMGKMRSGRWLVQGNELCIDLGADTNGGCYAVWMAGKAVELRPTGLGLPLQGVLERPNSPD
jgi:hypothetical protein